MLDCNGADEEAGLDASDVDDLGSTGVRVATSCCEMQLVSVALILRTLFGTR